jgi:hypothetical protein
MAPARSGPADGVGRLRAADRLAHPALGALDPLLQRLPLGVGQLGLPLLGLAEELSARSYSSYWM